MCKCLNRDFEKVKEIAIKWGSENKKDTYIYKSVMGLWLYCDFNNIPLTYSELEKVYTDGE